MKHTKFLHRAAVCLVVAAALGFIGAILAGAQTETVLYRFKGGADSGRPTAGLVSDKAGNLYGTTSGFQIGCGTVFEMVRPTSSGSPWIENPIYSFYCGDDDGTPEDALIIDHAGNVYGTTYNNGFGSVFELSPPATHGGTWTKTILHSLTQRDGDGGGSVASLVMNGAGNLYGTTEKGGKKDSGVVFELSPPAVPGGPWTEAILLTFSGGVSGAVPAAGLILDQAGNLYGTTFYGGSESFGVVFKLSPPATQGGAWKETNLHNFTGGSDGGYPAANLVLRGGNLYGSAVGSIPGGNCDPGCGVIFELSPPSRQGTSWKLTTLFAFNGGSDGASPEAPVVFDQAGNLYTTTYFGGQFGNGTVMELSPPSAHDATWTETILWNFEDGGDGVYPSSSLIFDPAGNLYGTTTYDGSGEYGTVFRIKP